MRSFLVTLILLVAVIVAVLAAAPRLVDWNDYRELLTRQAEAITGTAVAIEGRISFDLLPIPTLTLAQTRLTADDGARGVVRLGIDRIDLRLRPWAFLRGEIQIGDIRLVRPVLEIERPPERQAVPPGRDPLLRLVALRPNRLTVIDGRAVLPGGRAAVRQIDAIDVEMVGQSRDGPFVVRGDFETAARAFEIEAQIGRLSPDGVGTLQLTLAAAGRPSASLRYNGAVWWSVDDLRLRGELTLTGQATRSTVATVGGMLGYAPPSLPAWLDRPFEVSGRLELDGSRLRLDQLRVLLAEAQADGQLSLAFGVDPAMTLDLRAQELELADPVAVRPVDLAPLVALSRALRGEINLSLAALQYRDRRVERLRLKLTLTGDGEVAVDQASAILPGQTDLRFEGRLTAGGEGVALRGDLDAVSDDLGALLGWLELSPPGVASGRLRSLSVSSALAIDNDTVRLSQTEIRVDATQLRGSLGLETADAGDARRRIAADLVLDRLNVDAYRADLLPTDVADLLQRALRYADAEISTRVERLTWRGLPMRNVAIALHAEGGRFQVTNASLEVADEANVSLSGEADLESGTFAWTAEAGTTRIGRLLRRLGLAAPLMLSRAPPLTLSASATGRLEQFDLDAEIDDGAGRLAAVGKVGWLDGAPRYDLELELRHPDFNALVRPLGARTAVGGDAKPAALSFTGKLTGGVDQRTIAGSARLGDTSLTGLLAWQDGQPRPRYDLQLSVAEPTGDVITALLQLTGLVPPAGLLGAPVLGNWPQQALRLDWLRQFDGSLKLSAKGGLAGEGSELDARLQDAVLFVDRASARLPHGRLSTEITFDAGRPYPFLEASLDLREIDAAWLADQLDLDPVIEGSMDLLAEATAAGSTPYDLVRTLIGHIELAIGAGRLIGDEMAPIRRALTSGRNDHEGSPMRDSHAADPQALPFTDLVARFSLDRGIASAQSAKLELDGAAATVAGTVDLLIWAADLTFQVAGPPSAEKPITLRIVGPLKRPQTRLTLPPALPAATGP
ncbi:MAG TPA: AsmA family protein [Geminicoccaceae bacterium]|nr:AsmA family protein [Geminicoccaceae bacterium]